MKLTFTILFLLLTSWSMAWEGELVKRWEKSSVEHQNMVEGAAFATFWGGFRRGLGLYFHRGKMIEIRPEGFLKDLPVFLDNRQEKKDLYIFYPGVFGKPDGRISPQMIHEMEKKDAHLVVVPNLLAPTYLVARPKVEGDLVAGEGENQKKILKVILSLIGKEKINRVHIIAESLGAFQALTAFSPAENFSLEFDTLTLIWPPLDLGKAVKRFDELIERSLVEQKECTFWWKWPVYLYETKFKPLPSGLSSGDKSCLGAWVIGSGFVSSIKNTAEYFYEDKSMDTPEVPTTFMDFTTSVLPEFGPLISENDAKLKIISLLGPYQERRKKLRFVSSANDFLNILGEWEELRIKYPELSEKIYLFSWGGHSGPAGMEGFLQSLLK